MSASKTDQLASEPGAKFSKAAFSWRRTIYVLGMPRAGKSTILNLIASCRHVFSVDEPFEMQVVAQKAATHKPGSNVYSEYADAYSIIAENYFSELVLGRRYNFREQDRSCVFNYKEVDEIEASLRRDRRSDVVAYTSANDCVFAIAHNDVEDALDFITSSVPSPRIISLERDESNVADAIADREWLSDAQLSTLANVSPAYTTISQRDGRPHYIPYAILPNRADEFMQSDDRARARMFVKAKTEALAHGLARLPHVPHLAIDIQTLRAEPRKNFDRILDFCSITPTAKTYQILDEALRA